MKINTLVLSLVLIFGNLFAINAQDKKNSNLATVTFDVSLHCNDCKNKVEKNISWEKGVKDLVVSLEKKTVTVTFDTKQTSKENLQKAIEKLGYTCSDKCAAGSNAQTCKQSCDASKGAKGDCCKEGKDNKDNCCKKGEGADHQCDKAKVEGASCASTAKKEGASCSAAKTQGTSCAAAPEKK